MSSRVQEEEMRKKKDEPKEIPIKFAGEDEEAESQQGGNESHGREQAGADSGPADGAKPAAEASAAEEAAKDPRADLQAQVDALTQERSTLYDQLLRRQAEFENFRRRAERERTEAYQRARADVIMELLPTIDNFERAMSSLEKSEGDDAGALRHGVELIHKQFNDALAKLGLQAVEAVGQTFDPHLHEAVTIEPTDEHEENTVIEEFQRGYRLGDKLLRPAKVKVASSPDH